MRHSQMQYDGYSVATNAELIVPEAAAKASGRDPGRQAPIGLAGTEQRTLTSE